MWAPLTVGDERPGPHAKIGVSDREMLELDVMRITEAARRLGTSPRMLRYRDSLGLLPPVREDAAGRGHRHRQFGRAELEAVGAALRLEQRYDISPAALAFGLRVLADPAVRAAVTDLGRRAGRLPAPPERAVDFEKERALRLLSGSPAPRRR
jgi:MerR family copper efflux transcriptional regulator